MIMKTATDAIIIEFQSALDDFKINKITKIRNKIYDTGDINKTFVNSFSSYN